MEIRNIQPHQQSFKALHIANTKNYIQNVETPIQIYLLGANDSTFLLNLKNNINVRRLKSNLKKSFYDIWGGLLKETVNNCLKTKDVCLAAFHKGVPCGLITYTPNNVCYSLNSICTWPVEPEKKVPLAGKTLIKIMFDEFLKSDADFINLVAVTNGPFNVATKYKSLGFKRYGGIEPLLFMRGKRDDIIKANKRLDSFIKIETPPTIREVDLTKL